MKAKFVNATFAGLALLLGVVWLWGALVSPIIRCLSEGTGNRGCGFLFTMLTWMSLPGILAVYFGARLLNKNNEKNIKGAIGILMVGLAFFVSFQPAVLALFPVGIDREIARDASLLFGSFIALIAYLFLSKWALRVSGFPVAGIREVIGRVPFLLIAVLIWLFGSGLFRIYSPKEEGYTHVHKAPWELMGVLIPILSAWLFYKISIKACGIKKTELNPQAGSPPVAATGETVGKNKRIIMRSRQKSVGDNETFVTLIRVAQEDPEVRKTLAGILGQSPFHRKSLLNTLIQEMKLKGAPADFVFAIGALLDEAVAQQAAELIGNVRENRG